MRLSQNFSFGKATLDFEGKSGLFTAFSSAFPQTNRVLRKVHLIGGCFLYGNFVSASKEAPT
jgi:hypothetical protein